MAIRPEWFVKFASKNPGLKALALLFALFSYFSIRAATSDEKTFDVPVEVRVEPGVAVMSQEPMAVEVTLRGSEEDLGRLERNKENLRVVVRPRASDPDEPEEVVRIGAGDIEGAPRVHPVAIRPDRVRVRFDRDAKRTVNVAKPKTRGTPLRGTVEIEFEPLQVEIHGSHRGLRDVESVDTEPVDVDGRVQSFTRRVKVLSPANIWVSRIEPPEVTVKVNIVTRSVDRVWTNVPVMAVLEPGAIKSVVFDPGSVSVAVKGRAETVEALTEKDLKVFVDCGGLQPGTTNIVTATAHLPPGVDIATTLTPEAVTVVVGPQEEQHGNR